MGRAEPPGMRDVSHSDAVSGNSTVQTNGSFWTPAASRLEPIRHRACSLPAEAHVPEELEQGYAWVYERLFSGASIWRRRPEDWRAVAPYLAMSYLYKRSNWIWHLLIKHHLVHAAWRPLIELTRLRHLSYRRKLSAETQRRPGATVVSAGV